MNAHIPVKATAKKAAKNSAPIAQPADSLSDALARLEHVRVVYNDALQSQRESSTKTRELNTEIAAAVRVEDFALAAKLKEQRTTLEAKSSPQTLAAHRAALSEAMQRASELYFAKYCNNMHTQVTLTRIVVCNPTTSNCAEAVFLDADAYVTVSLDGHYFEAEARHLESWAHEKMFLLRSYTVNVEV